MKALPVKIALVVGYVSCPPEEATHLTIIIPGPSSRITLPVQIKGRREGTGNWTWNCDREKPTLKPSLLTKGHGYGGQDGKERVEWVCHTWINDGKAQFLEDSTHAFAGQTLDLLNIFDTP